MENIDLQPQDAQQITPLPAVKEFQLEMVDFGPAYKAIDFPSLCACATDCNSGCTCGGGCEIWVSEEF